MMNDVDIKNKRILLFDFDGTLIETASGNTFATDLTDMRIKMDVVNKALDLMQENGVKVFAIVSNQGGVDDVLNIRIDKDQNFNSYSDVVKIEVLEDNTIKYTSLYHESKENGDSLS